MTDLTAAQRFRVWAAAGVPATIGPDDMRSIARRLDAADDSFSRAMAALDAAKSARVVSLIYMIGGVIAFGAAVFL